MSYLIPTGTSYRRAEIIVVRAGAMSTGSTGTYVNIEWDNEGSNLPKDGFTHSTVSNREQVIPIAAGVYLWSGLVKLDDGTWDELRLSPEVNGSPIQIPNAGAATGLLGLTTSPGSVGFSFAWRLAAGDVVRLRAASIGQSNVPLQIGATNCWMSLVRLY